MVNYLMSNLIGAIFQLYGIRGDHKNDFNYHALRNFFFYFFFYSEVLKLVLRFPLFLSLLSFITHRELTS